MPGASNLKNSVIVLFVTYRPPKPYKALYLFTFLKLRPKKQYNSSVLLHYLSEGPPSLKKQNMCIYIYVCIYPMFLLRLAFQHHTNPVFLYVL